MDVLRALESLNLPDWLVGAGFVRNPIWDVLHGQNPSEVTDIDVAYFDASDLSEDTEKRYEDALRELMDAPWSVTNQARMGVINNQNRQYTSTCDAIAHWPETATAVGVRLDKGKISVIAPHSLKDLLDLKLRMTPDFGDGEAAFRARIEKKRWLARWPKLSVVKEHRSA
jgi:hypothetical protein